MKRFLPIALAFLLAASPAGSGTMPLLGAGKAAAGGAAPTVSFVAGTNSNSGSGTATRTYASVNIGNPAYIATRRVIAIVGGGTTGRTLSSCTINAVACDTVTTLTDASNSMSMYVGSAVVTSGTTGVTVAMTYSSTEFNNNGLITYNVDNSLLSSPTPVTANVSNTSVTSATEAVAVLSGGFIILAQMRSGGTAATITSSDAGITSDQTSFNMITGHVSNVAASAASNAAVGWTTAANSNLALLAYR